MPLSTGTRLGPYEFLASIGPPMFEENRGRFQAATTYFNHGAGYQFSFEPGLAEILARSAAHVLLSFLPCVDPSSVDRMVTKLNYFQGNDPRMVVAP